MTDQAPTTERQDPVGEVIASNLRAWRQRKGWSLERTAGRLSPFLDTAVSPSSLQQWETISPPRRFTFHETYAICRVFKQPLAALILPDMQQFIDPPYPTINGDPYGEIWRVCFEPMHADENPLSAGARIQHMWNLLSKVEPDDINELDMDGHNGDR